MLTLLSIIFTALVSSQNNSYPNPAISTYFPNWAQYTAAPYTVTPSTIKNAINSLNVINYAFAYFCPSPDMIQPYWVDPPYSVCDGKQPFQITNIEYNDAQMYKEVCYNKTYLSL